MQTQQIAIQHSGSEHNAMQHNRHSNGSQHNATQCNTTKHNTTQLTSTQQTRNKNHAHVLNKPVEVTLSLTENSMEKNGQSMVDAVMYE